MGSDERFLAKAHSRSLNCYNRDDWHVRGFQPGWLMSLGEVIRSGSGVGVRRGWRRKECGEASFVLRRQAFVTVEPENPVARRMAQAFGARGGEVVLPGEIVDVGAKAASDIACAIG